MMTAFHILLSSPSQSKDRAIPDPLFLQNHQAPGRMGGRKWTANLSQNTEGPLLTHLL